jgi:enamine deaminase RidA (YjgF/YER057c/UK114 family)
MDPMTQQQPDDPMGQIRQAFHNLEALLGQAGASWDDVIHVYAFLADRPAHQPLLDEVWPELYAYGRCPARKAMQYAELRRWGSWVELQAVANIGQGPRRDFELPNVPVHDTGTMGAAIGSKLWSCGLAGNPGGRLHSLEEQAEWAARHLNMLVELAGGNLDDVGFATIMLRGYDDLPAVMKYWRELFPDPADEPAHHPVAFGLNPRNEERVQYHIVAAFPPDRR